MAENEFEAADELARDVYALADKMVSQRSLNRLGLGSARIVKKRTREGKDVEGKTFRKYSDRYAALKLLADEQADPVNLQYGVRKVKGKKEVESNRYKTSMDALDHVVSSDLATVEVLFTEARAEQIMTYHNVEGAGKSRVIRRNMGHSEAETDDLMAQFEGDINEAFKVHNLG